MLFNEFVNNGLIISTKKMELCKEYIEFLGMNIGKGKIKLQEHIVKKILDFPDKIEDTKKLQVFLGMLSYARMYIKYLSKLIGRLYSKTKSGGQKFFNSSYIELVREIKNICRNLSELALPLVNEYKVIETYASERG